MHTSSLIYLYSEHLICRPVDLPTINMSTSIPSISPHNISNLPKELKYLHVKLTYCQPVYLSTCLPLHYLIQADPKFRFAHIPPCLVVLYTSSYTLKNHCVCIGPFGRKYVILAFLLDFSILYTTLPHNLIKDKLIDLIKEPSREKALLTLYVMTGKHFLIRKNLKKISCMVMSKRMQCADFFVGQHFC